MSFSLEDYAAHEIRHAIRRGISNQVRDECPDTDPMVKGVIVMLGCVLAVAAFDSIYRGRGIGRTR